MIEAIVARIYYKILTIEHVFSIGHAAICRLFLYVIVGWSVFGLPHLIKDSKDCANDSRANDSTGSFQCDVRLVKIRALVGV